MMKQAACYGVKLMYRYETGGEVYYEESVLRVRASSFDDAMEKAEEYADSLIDRNHINPFGLEVRESVCDVMDCFLMQESGGEIEEVYSAFHRNRTDLSENEYIEMMFDECSEEELQSLRYWEFND